MNMREFVELEATTTRAIRSAKHFASGTDHEALLRLEYVVAELRHAAGTLCNPCALDEHRKAAKERLLHLFTCQ